MSATSVRNEIVLKILKHLQVNSYFCVFVFLPGTLNGFIMTCGSLGKRKNHVLVKGWEERKRETLDVEIGKNDKKKERQKERKKKKKEKKKEKKKKKRKKEKKKD